jgi:hypothetical protein
MVLTGVALARFLLEGLIKILKIKIEKGGKGLLFFIS